MARTRGYCTRPPGFDEPCKLRAHLVRHGHGAELSPAHRHQNVLAGGHDRIRLLAAPDGEVEVDRAVPDAAEIRLYDQQLVEHDGVEEVALHPHPRQPDPDLIE